jgi:hypothetical protein
MILVTEYDHFVEGARFDWLHPSCGRWPDLAAIFARNPQDQDGLLSAVWWDGHIYAVVVEGPDDHHTIIQTYRWEPRSDGTLWCRVHANRGAVLDIAKDQIARIRQVAEASCRLFLEC